VSAIKIYSKNRSILGKVLRKGKKILASSICNVLLLLLFVTARTEAQDGSDWSPAFRLSSENVRPSEGYMVADRFGYLHVFWIEEDLADGDTVIQYSRFDGENWTPPNDIYVLRLGGWTIIFLSPFVDQQGSLHLIWSEGNTGPVYYSSAPAQDALSAQHWSRPLRIDIPAYQARLQIDSKGVIHILYADFYGIQPGIYHTSSKDQGWTWTSPTWIDADIPAGHAPGHLQFMLDETGNLHAVWSYLDLQEASQKYVRYAHSLDGGRNWSLPITIDEADESSGEVRLARPGLVVSAETVHVIWAGTERTNREHRISADAGQTWGEPFRIFGDFHGQAAGDGLSFDAAGRLLFASQIRYPQAIWFAYWDDNRWSPLSVVTTDFPSAHYVRLAVRAGNQAVITFTPDSERSALYAITHTLEDVITLPSAPTSITAATASPVPNPTSTLSALNPTQSVQKLDLGEATPPVNLMEPSNAIWLALSPVLLLVGGIIAYHLVKRH
jgi:catechol 2,3-dioxygenase-like lactoylglutathione lyase family enzyme